MLSFGIEYERAFSIAFWSARFAAGVGSALTRRRR
jgi:hypothetical protein